MSKRYRIAADIQLPPATAFWVLSAHLFALLVPLVLIAAVYRHWDALAGLTAYPVLFYVAAGVMMAGSAFEVSQNAQDHWYLTPETGSATGTGFCDCMFFWCIVASQGLVAVACIGNHLWVPVLAVFFTLLFPFLYIRQTLPFLPLSVLGLLATVAAYLSLGDPVVLLQLVMSPLTMYFFRLLLKTGNQMLHACTTMAASSGVLFLAWGVHGGSEGMPQTWIVVATIAVVTLIAAAVMRPALASLPQTLRPQALGE
jgi:hypothetical protein